MVARYLVSGLVLNQKDSKLALMLTEHRLAKGFVLKEMPESRSWVLSSGPSA